MDSFMRIFIALPGLLRASESAGPDAPRTLGTGPFRYAGTRDDRIVVERSDDYWGGLLDVSLHPEFSQNGWVYIAYVDATWGLAVARFALEDGRAADFRVLFRSPEFSIGSRIVWQDPEHFFLSHGIGGTTYTEPGPHDLGRDLCKSHRLAADGPVPEDNPVLTGHSVPPSIWT